MKKMLIAIFQATFNRRKLTKHQPISTTAQRTNNVVQMDRRTSPTGTDTGRGLHTYPVPSSYKRPTLKQAETVPKPSNYDTCSASLNSLGQEAAWIDPVQDGMRTSPGPNHQPNFHGHGGTFDGGGSSGDWSSSSSDSGFSGSND